MNEPEEVLDPRLNRVVLAMREAPPRPLSVDFTDRVMAASLQAGTSREAEANATVAGWARALVDRLVRPRSLVLRPVRQFAFAAALCLASSGLTLWMVRGEEPAVAQPGVLVRFSVEASTATSVSLAGDFNRWTAEEIRLEDRDGDGVWQAMVPLTPGVYQYMFVVDGSRWIPDPSSPESIDDGFGRANSIVRIAGPARLEVKGGRRAS